MADKKISGLTELTTPVNADELAVVDTSATETKRTTWANIKATMKTYMDTLYGTTTDVGLNTTHRTSSGVDHSYIDQDVTSGSTPTLTATNISGLPSSGLVAGVGIADDNIVEIDDTDAANLDYCRLTVNGIEGRSYSQVRTDINVEDGADVTDATNVATAGAAMAGGAFHDGFSDFVADEHVAHTGVTLTAGTGLTGGGTIAANRTFNVDVGIADDKIVRIDDADAANLDYCRLTTLGVEGRSYAEVRTDINVADGADVSGDNAPQAHKDSHDPEDGGDALDTANAAEIAGVQAAGTGTSHSLARADHAHQIQHAITDNHLVTIDDADAADDDYCKLTANGIEGREKSEVLSDLNVEDGADVTDATNVNAAGAIMESDVDAKGDVLVATADNTVTRLAVGSNTNVLTADSGEASGIKWAAAGTPGAHASTHEDGGADEISISALAGTSTALTTPVLTTSVSGTAFKDEDDMSSDSATVLASQQSIKAYSDAKDSNVTSKASVTQTSSSSSTYADVTGSSQSVVISKTSNVLVTARINMQNNTNTSQFGIRLLRDSTVVAELPDETFRSANRQESYFMTAVESGVTAATYTYKLQVKSVDNSTTVYALTGCKFQVTEL